MKWRTLIGTAVAAAFASGAAFAGSFSYGTEVQTPTSVNESAPWRALEDSGYVTQAARMHQVEIVPSDSAVGTGASSSVSAFGTAGFDSSIDAATGEAVDYWRMDDSSDVGSTTGSGSGSGSFSSSMSDELSDEGAVSKYSLITPIYGDELAAFNVYGDEFADAGALDEPLQSATTYYGDSLALLLDTGISSEEMEA